LRGGIEQTALPAFSQAARSFFIAFTPSVYFNQIRQTISHTIFPKDVLSLPRFAKWPVEIIRDESVG